MKDCGFVICTDAWEQTKAYELEKNNEGINVGVIKITKKPLKKLEDILAPLHDEYIFFYSEDIAYLEKLRDFSASKKNLIMGVEIEANMISVHDYLKTKVGNEQ